MVMEAIDGTILRSYISYDMGLPFQLKIHGNISDGQQVNNVCPQRHNNQIMFSFVLVNDIPVIINLNSDTSKSSAILNTLKCPH